jgi:hypothetical protein
MAPDLETWISEIKSRNAVIFEKAYHGERPSGAAVVPRLLAEMRATPDAFTRGKFIELLAEMADASIVPDLLPELAHPHQDVRQWAVTSLRALGGEVADRAVAEYEREHPNEFA